MEKKRFDTVDNPALSYLSSDDTDAEPAVSSTEERAAVPPKSGWLGLTADLAVQPRTERKSKRMNLLLKPSTLDEIRKIAGVRNVSVNAYINAVLEQAVRIEAKTLDGYKEDQEQ